MLVILPVFGFQLQLEITHLEFAGVPQAVG
jgi:hypothetical protein